jgi:hypothetical protein
VLKNIVTTKKASMISVYCQFGKLPKLRWVVSTIA